MDKITLDRLNKLLDDKESKQGTNPLLKVIEALNESQDKQQFKADKEIMKHLGVKSLDDITQFDKNRAKIEIEGNKLDQARQDLRNNLGNSLADLNTDKDRNFNNEPIDR